MPADHDHSFERRQEGATFTVKELFLRVEAEVAALNIALSADLRAQDRRIVTLEMGSASREAVERNEAMIRRVIIAVVCALVGTSVQVIIFIVNLLRHP